MIGSAGTADNIDITVERGTIGNTVPTARIDSIGNPGSTGFPGPTGTTYYIRLCSIGSCVSTDNTFNTW